MEVPPLIALPVYILAVPSPSALVAAAFQDSLGLNPFSGVLVFDKPVRSDFPRRYNLLVSVQLIVAW